MNADWPQRGGAARVTFFDDRIEIQNPGILPPGMTVEDMRQNVSKIRNPVIARVFQELKLIEQWGSGVPRIFREKAAAVDLIETHKAEKLGIDHWRDRESIRDTVLLTIQNFSVEQGNGIA